MTSGLLYVPVIEQVAFGKRGQPEVFTAYPLQMFCLQKHLDMAELEALYYLGSQTDLTPDSLSTEVGLLLSVIGSK